MPANQPPASQPSVSARAWLSLALSMTAVGCAFDASIPPGAVVACSRDEDCPTPTRCRIGLGVCVDPALATPGCGDSIIDSGELCDDGNNADGDGCRADCRKIEECGDRVIDIGEQCDDGNANPADECDECHTSTWIGSVFGHPLELVDTQVVHSLAGLAVDAKGQVYVIDQTTCEVLRRSLDGGVVVVAGVGGCSSDSADGIATEVQLYEPSALAVADDGAIFIAALAANNPVIQRIDPTSGLLQTIAGAPGLGGGGDDGPAALASFGHIRDLKVDPQGRIYISDSANHRLRRIEPNNNNVITTIAGNGLTGLGGEGVIATAAPLDVDLLAIDAVDGGVYIAEPAQVRVRRLRPDGSIETAASGLSADVALAAHDGRLFLFDGANSTIRRQNPDGTFTAIAGTGLSGHSGDGGPATAAAVTRGLLALDSRPFGGVFDQLVLLDRAGVRRIDDTGVITTVVGSGVRLPLSQQLPPTTALSPRVMTWDAVTSSLLVVSSPLLVRIDDHGLPTPIGGLANQSAGSALFVGFNPTALAVDSLGSIFLSETPLIRRIDIDGTVSVVAGGTVEGHSADGTVATEASVRPGVLAFDVTGRLVFVDRLSDFDCSIRRIDNVDGIDLLTTLAGTLGGPLADGVLATSASLGDIAALSYDLEGRLLMADANRSCVRRIEDDGTITTVAGRCGVAGFAGDGGPARQALLQSPRGLAVSVDGRMFIADTFNQTVRVVDQGGQISTLVGSGTLGHGGDGGPALLAQLTPTSLAIDSFGRLLITDLDSETATVRRLDTDGTISTVVGGKELFTRPTLHQQAATTVDLAFPAGLATGYPGTRVLIADPIANSIVAVVDGVLAVVAGTGAYGAAGDGGPAADAELGGPLGVTVDGLGRMLIADTLNHRIRRVDVDGTISTIAGTGLLGLLGDGQAATSAQLNLPGAVDVDDAGAVYIADTGNHCVRVIDNGVIRTLAGSGVGGFGGDGQPALFAELHSPAGVAVDADGRVYIADTGNARVRRVGLDGTIETIVGTGVAGFGGDGGLAKNAEVFAPTGIAIDALGRLVIADPFDSRVRRVDVDGTISTIFGSSQSGSSGDGAQGLGARLTDPMAVAFDAEGRLFVADTHLGHVREMDANGLVKTTVGQVTNIGRIALNDPVFGLGLPTNILNLDSSTSLIASDHLLALRHDLQQIEPVGGRYFQQIPTAALARYTDATFPEITAIAFDADSATIFIGTRLYRENNTVEYKIFGIHAADIADADHWTIKDLAGHDTGDADGAAHDAQFNEISALHFDLVQRRLYIADSLNGCLRTFDVDDDIVSTLLGPTSFDEQGPQALAQSPRGDLFVLDSTRVQRVQLDTGETSVVIGDGNSLGDGVRSRDLTITAPSGLATDSIGNIFVSSAKEVRLLSARDGVVDGEGPSQILFPRGPSEHPIDCINDIASYNDDTLQLVDCSGLMVVLHRRRD